MNDNKDKMNDNTDKINDNTDNGKRRSGRFKELSKKDKIKKITGLAVMLLGVAVIVSVIVVPLANRKRNDDNVELIKSNMKATAESVNTDDNTASGAAADVTDEVVEVSEDAVAARRAQLLEESGCIGVIVIDKIGVELAIAEGDDDETLKHFVGHMTSSSALGANGNCVLSAHHGGYYGEFFKNISQLEDEDIIYLIDKNGQLYKYAVYDKKQIKRTDWSVVDDLNSDMATLTLITCVDTTQEERIIVSAIRFE